MRDHTFDATPRPLSSTEAEIVALLQHDGRLAYADVSKMLDLPEPTVRRIVRRLVDDRVIAITAVANPRLLGLEAMAWIGVKVDWSQASDLQAQMLEIRGVDYVVTTTGSFSVMAEVSARDLRDLLERMESIRRLPGVTATESFLYLDLFHQEFRWVGPGTPDDQRRHEVRDPRPIGEFEQKLILALRADGRRSFRQIAAQLGVSQRQVRSAYARLTSSGAVRVMAVLNPARMGLNTMAWVGIRGRPSVPVTEIAQAVADEPRVDYVVICTGRFDVLAEVACANVEELATVVARNLGAIAGIEEIEVFSYLRLQYRDESVWSAGRVSALETDDGGAVRAVGWDGEAR